MKKYIFFPLLLISFNCAIAQKFMFVKCISGDCLNGKGSAEFTAPQHDGTFKGAVVYNGTFKDGKMWGEGTVNDTNYYGHYYAGNFEDNYYMGYGTEFQLKTVGKVPMPDSTGYTTFYKWDEDGCNINLSLQRDNYQVAGRFENNKRHKKFWGNFAFNDDGIMQRVHALKKSGARGYVPEYEDNIIAEKNIAAQRGSTATLIAWECLADRQYFVTASAVKNGRFTVMPFGGYVNYQVTAADGTVVFEGAVDRYWKPLKDGKYTFTVKFDQGQISGNSNLYEDVVTLGCSLRSHRLL